VDFDGSGDDPASPAVTRWADCFAVDGLICADQTCQAAPGAGEPCFEGSICEKGLHCDEAGVCSAATSSVCETCSSDAFCSDALVCEGKRAEGAPCRGDEYCVSGLCNGETIETKTCAAIQTVGPLHGGESECGGRIRF
jgi:hypothetical protein